MEQKLLFEKRPLELRKLQNHYIGNGIGNARFELYDSDGRLLEYTGNYPYNQGKAGIDLSYLYQSQLCAYPGSNYFASGCLLCDDLEFFKVENNHCKLLKKYNTFDIKAKMNNNRIDISDDCIINYTYSYPTKKYCYMLYSGKTFIKNKGPMLGHYVIVFDWEGNYYKTYELDIDITSFCVEETTQKIYGINNDPDYQIIEFSYD
jgi:hypothetical protein